MNEQHLGSTLDEFLEEEGLLAEAEAVAARRVLAYQVETVASEKQSSKAKPAGRTYTTGENAKSC
jgi:antitoxin HicB